ncbi:hypothetical protein FNFX1_1073 [Francisella cf. novicida Fx1]|nr:hypothetical protein FNFX1_1073 [Francisella cf. novicida Fx1]
MFKQSTIVLKSTKFAKFLFLSRKKDISIKFIIFRKYYV